MPAKKSKRQLAMEKNKRNTRIIVAIIIAVLALLIAAVIISINSRNETRVFASFNNTVELRGDGTFTANLPHGVVREGTFTESTTGGVTTVLFDERGRTAAGSINGNVLTIPSEWDDGHRHPRNYMLRP